MVDTVQDGKKNASYPLVGKGAMTEQERAAFLAQARRDEINYAPRDYATDYDPQHRFHNNVPRDQALNEVIHERGELISRMQALLEAGEDSRQQMRLDRYLAAQARDIAVSDEYRRMMEGDIVRPKVIPKSQAWYNQAGKATSSDPVPAAYLAKVTAGVKLGASYQESPFKPYIAPELTGADALYTGHNESRAAPKSQAWYNSASVRATATDPTPDAYVKRVSASSRTGGAVGVALITGLVAASAAEAAYNTPGGIDEKSNALKDSAIDGLKNLTPIVGSVEAMKQGNSAEAAARFADWTPIGEINRYAVRYSDQLQGKPLQVAPGMLESISYTLVADAKYLANAANEKLNNFQRAIGTPAPMTPQEEFVKTAKYMMKTGDTEVKVPDYKSVELKASVESFAQLYKHLSTDGQIGEADRAALALSVNTIAKGFENNTLHSMVQRYEESHVSVNNREATSTEQDMALTR